jgi:hypothetical protein
MENNKILDRFDLVWPISSVLLWYFTVFPFDSTYTIDDINMNFFALVILFTMVFSHVLIMLEDYRLTLLVSLGGVLELLVWERMMGFGFGATLLLFTVGVIFVVSYKHYPRP